MAFEYATRLNLKISNSWIESKKADEDWLESFLSRHTTLSIRKPEPTSLTRASNFNKFNAGKFFENLQNALSSHDIGPGSIQNMGKTGVTTVQRADRTIEGEVGN